MKGTTYIITAMLMLASGATAQTINFDSTDYSTVEVYDSWTDSPLRNGRLEGNAAVIDNHLQTDTMGPVANTSPRTAAIQRSRYASNLFGLRVNLTQPFRLTRDERYVHVLIHRPVDDSHCMLITLGRRSGRPGQSTQVEQTWSLSATPVGRNGWYDAVFPIKGFSVDDPQADGIDVYSLVVCPDVTDRSTTTTDFACYIDQIEINNNPEPRTTTSATK